MTKNIVLSILIAFVIFSALCGFVNFQNAEKIMNPEISQNHGKLTWQAEYNCMMELAEVGELAEEVIVEICQN